VALDFEEIRRHAQAQSVPKSEIAIVCENLNDDHFEALNAPGLVVRQLDGGRCLGRFSPEGRVLFPEMATGVVRLGA
jgi:hypothetical protein